MLLVHRTNLLAVGLYEHCGFSKIQEVEDCMLMEKMCSVEAPAQSLSEDEEGPSLGCLPLRAARRCQARMCAVGILAPPAPPPAARDILTLGEGFYSGEHPPGAPLSRGSNVRARVVFACDPATVRVARRCYSQL